MKTNIVKGAIAVGVILGVLAFFGLTPFGKQILAIGSPAGSTFGTAKIASEVPSVSTSTLLAILNTDTSDRIIDSANVNLLASSAFGIPTTTVFTIKCATSTVATGITPANTNYIYNQSIASSNDVFGSTTTQGGYYVASSSPGITGTTTPNNLLIGAGVAVNQFARVWKTGTYLVCENVTTVGSASNLLASTTVGAITFGYHGN